MERLPAKSNLIDYKIKELPLGDLEKVGPGIVALNGQEVNLRRLFQPGDVINFQDLTENVSRAVNYPLTKIIDILFTLPDAMKEAFPGWGEIAIEDITRVDGEIKIKRGWEVPPAREDMTF